MASWYGVVYLACEVLVALGSNRFFHSFLNSRKQGEEGRTTSGPKSFSPPPPAPPSPLSFSPSGAWGAPWVFLLLILLVPVARVQADKDGEARLEWLKQR